MQVVIVNAGHMLPHDQGEAALTMLETWVDKALSKKQHSH
jgi:carboxypeptidase C (cathepsin A)